MGIGERIQLIRKDKGFTQAQFADRIKVDRSYISQIENGKAEPKKIVLLAIHNVLGVDMGWLENGNGEMYDNKWELLKEYARGLGDDVYSKLVLKENMAEHYSDLADNVFEDAGPGRVREDQAVFGVNIKREIADHNKNVIANMLAKVARIINEGDYRKTSAIQSMLDVLDPGEEGKDEA